GPPVPALARLAPFADLTSLRQSLFSIRFASHFTTGTLTAFPTNRHRSRSPWEAESSVFVQLAEKPCIRSASRMLGTTKSRVSTRQIAGGEGIDKPEPPFNGGMAPGDQPRPVLPSVQ